MDSLIVTPRRLGMYWILVEHVIILFDKHVEEGLAVW
jgi:hypothetical protein